MIVNIEQRTTAPIEIMLRIVIFRLKVTRTSPQILPLLFSFPLLISCFFFTIRTNKWFVKGDIFLLPNNSFSEPFLKKPFLKIAKIN